MKPKSETETEQLRVKFLFLFQDSQLFTVGTDLRKLSEDCATLSIANSQPSISKTVEEQKREWYLKLLAKLGKIHKGELTLEDYTKEVIEKLK